MVDKIVGAPLKELQKAVDDKNSTAFATAYDRLSAGCNTCHHALSRAFIAIQRPTMLPYQRPILRAAEITPVKKSLSVVGRRHARTISIQHRVKSFVVKRALDRYQLFAKRARVHCHGVRVGGFHVRPFLDHGEMV